MRGVWAGVGLAAAVFAVWRSSDHRSLRVALPIIVDPYTRRPYEGPPVTITLITTNDLHSTADGCCGPDSFPARKQGGYDRLLHTISRVRAARRVEGGLVLTVDAGDWYSGTLFSSLGPSAAAADVPELAFFAAAQYDAVALGNHDFDAGVPGLHRMLTKQQADQRHIPPAVLCANLLLRTGNNEREALSTVKPFVVKEMLLPGSGDGGKGGGVLRVGIFALMGADAAFASRGNRGDGAAFTGYDDATDARHPELMHARARSVVAELRGAQRCDVVICLLHGGRDGAEADNGVSGGEDGALARAVPGIDAIVAGHTHGARFKAGFCARGCHWIPQCSLGANMRVTNGILLGSPLLLPLPS
jgi:5'-nucleotidase